jgi:succinate-semialdehyde dehydrogenase/glutarate-semialdehyde dehydrogenase
MHPDIAYCFEDQTIEDADLRAAVEGAAAIKCMRVAGQSCICANRLYVQESIAARFLPALIDRVRAIKVGDGFQPGVEVGPLINDATLHKVESLVQDAVAKGAQVAVGGQRLGTGALSKGWFYAPTVLLDVRDEMLVCQEEIFGPVAPVLTFRILVTDSSPNFTLWLLPPMPTPIP